MPNLESIWYCTGKDDFPCSQYGWSNLSAADVDLLEMMAHMI